LDGGWRYATIADVDHIFAKLFDGFYATNVYGSSDSFQSPYADQLTDIYAFQSLFGFVDRYSENPSDIGNRILRMTYGMYGDENVRTGFGNRFSLVNMMGAYEDICVGPSTCNNFIGNDVAATFAPGTSHTEIYGTERQPTSWASTADPVVFTFAVRDHCTGECERTFYVPEPSITLLIASGLIAIGVVRRKAGT
jgi:hypothetical protein